MLIAYDLVSRAVLTCCCAGGDGECFSRREADFLVGLLGDAQGVQRSSDAGESLVQGRVHVPSVGTGEALLNFCGGERGGVEFGVALICINDLALA